MPRTSQVEQAFLKGAPARFEPPEKADVIVTSSLPELGKLAALKFIEFVQSKPDGVVSLPTGKTPEFFIKWVQRFLNSWDQEEMRAFGLHPVKPSMAQLRFVQMDEFVPIRPSQKNSFHHFISQYYIEGFGLDPSNCLLIDTSHIFRTEDSLDSETVHELDLYCAEYERKIKKNWKY